MEEKKYAGLETLRAFKGENDKLYATKTAVEELAEEVSDVDGKIGAHNVSTSAHNDIRLLISGLTDRLNALANSDDTTLDQMAEVVDYIKSNRDLISEITTNKVNVSDIIDNLTTNVSDKPLSAAQGVALKTLIDAIVIPVQSVNGMTGEVSLGASDVGADASGTAASAVSTHDSSGTAHTDIRALIDEAKEAAEDAATALTTHNSDTTAHEDIRDAALQKSGGTMSGALVAQNNNNYDTKQVRNIFLVAEGEDLPAGSNGDICLVYTP